MDSLRGCVFSEEFRRSLTDLSEFTYIDAENRDKLSLLLHEFECKVGFGLSVNLHHLISQLFGAAEPREELVIRLIPVATAVENELPDTEAVTAELAAILSEPILTTLAGDDLSLRDDLDQAGEFTTNSNLVPFPPSFLFITILFACVAVEDFTALIDTVTRHLRPHVNEAILDARKTPKPSLRQVVEMSRDSFMKTKVLGEESIFFFYYHLLV